MNMHTKDFWGIPNVFHLWWFKLISALPWSWHGQAWKSTSASLIFLNFIVVSLFFVCFCFVLFCLLQHTEVNFLMWLSIFFGIHMYVKLRVFVVEFIVMYKHICTWQMISLYFPLYKSFFFFSFFEMLFIVFKEYFQKSCVSRGRLKATDTFCLVYFSTTIFFPLELGWWGNNVISSLV